MQAGTTVLGDRLWNTNPTLLCTIEVTLGMFRRDLDAPGWGHVPADKVVYSSHCCKILFEDDSDVGSFEPMPVSAAPQLGQHSAAELKHEYIRQSVEHWTGLTYH